MHTAVLLVIIDGVGDVGIEKLKGKTPLQASRHVFLDAIASSGVCGLMDPVEPGLACGSDTAHMSILGYSPKKYYRGRGAFESLGAGIDMKPGDLAFKSNFATLDRSKMIVVSRRADRQFELEGPELCAALDNLKLRSFPLHTVRVKYATEHRCGVCIRGPDLNDAVTGTDPLKDNLPLIVCAPLDKSAIGDHSSQEEDQYACEKSKREEQQHFAAELTSRLVNELSEVVYETLVKHPINEDRRKRGKPEANILLFRGAGCMLDVPSFTERHSVFKKPFFIAPTCIIAGLGKSLGIEVISVPGATGDYSTNLMAKANASINALTKNNYDFGLLHIKAVDDAGHDKRLDIKLDFLERIDKMIGVIVEKLKEDEKISDRRYVIAVTGDHSTLIEFGDHSCEPVPFAMAKISEIVLSASDVSFDEISVAGGCLGRFSGNQVMPIITQIISSCHGSNIISLASSS